MQSHQYIESCTDEARETEILLMIREKILGLSTESYLFRDKPYYTSLCLNKNIKSFTFFKILILFVYLVK